VRAGLVEHARHEVGKGEAGDPSNGDAGDGEREAVTDDEPEQVGVIGAEGEADTGAEEIILNAQFPVVLTGIEARATRAISSTVPW
jgi:hypothetical protein